MENQRTISPLREPHGGPANVDAQAARIPDTPSPTIAALLTDPTARSRLLAAAGNLGTPRFAVSADDLLLLLVRYRVGAVIIDCEMNGIPTERLIRVVRRDHPFVPVLVYCDLAAEQMRLVPALIRAGADELVLRGIDDMRSMFQRLILTADSARAASQALEALRDVTPRGGAPFLAYCLSHADRPLTVDAMARDLGVHRKTLCNRAAAAGLPAPSTLISWCRLLHAARLLEDSSRSVERTALLLGFGSGTALRNMLRRYTGLRPADLRARGGARTIIQLLRGQLETQAPSAV